MWSTNFLPSKLTEILGNLSRFQLLKNLQKCLISSILKIQRRFSPNFGKLIIFWCNVCHLSVIGNQRRYSSRLSIPMFIETPCIRYCCRTQSMWRPMSVTTFQNRLPPTVPLGAAITTYKLNKETNVRFCCKISKSNFGIKSWMAAK